MKVTISFHWILHGLTLAFLAPKIFPVVNQYLNPTAVKHTRDHAKRHPDSIPASSVSSAPSSVTPNSSLSHPRRFSTSASCHGGESISSRRCRFRNLCFHIVDKAFLFSHDVDDPAILKGVPEDRSSPALAELSSVENHNGEQLSMFANATHDQ